MSILDWVLAIIVIVLWNGYLFYKMHRDYINKEKD